MKKLILIIMLLCVIVIAGLHMFLTYRLNYAVQEWVLPMISEHTGLDVRIDSVSINLPARALTINGLQIDNPPGFFKQNMLSFERGSISIGLMPFLKGDGVEIRKARAKDVKLSVVRERDGRINIQEAGELLQAEPAPATTHATTAATQETPEQLKKTAPGMPDFRINDMKTEFLVQYIDHTLSDEGFHLSVNVDLQMKNIASYGPPDELSGAITANGRIFGHGNSGTFQADGMIGPIIDPMLLSFVASIRLDNIVLETLGAMAEKQGLKPGSISGNLNLRCEAGVFDSKTSELRLTFHDTKLAERLSKKMSDIEALETINVIAPISGTLIEPKIDIQRAIQRSLMSDEVFGTILKNIMEQDQRTPNLLKEINIEQTGGKSDKSRTIDVEGIIRNIRRRPR